MTEKRSVTAETRFDEDNKSLVGRAVIYNDLSEILYGSFRETLLPGCFDESLESGRDVYCSIDHDECKLLGRLSSGTLTLIPDDDGISVKVPMPDYSYAKDLALAIQRKDLSGMSFIFDVLDDAWSMKDGVRLRTVKKADLYEVAFVFFPAYSATTADIRGVPMAFPLNGERSALSRMFLAMDKPKLDAMRRRMRVAITRG